MVRPPQLVIITDIDGTLIDRATYEVGPAGPVLAAAVAQGVPVVLCSSKTRPEQRYLRRRLGITDPFIVENGSAIVIPDGAFGPATMLPAGTQRSGRHRVLTLGRPVVEIYQELARVREDLGLSFKTYSDLAREDVVRLTGLDDCAAGRAMQRQYSETIVSSLTPPEISRLRLALQGSNLTLAGGGRFHTVSGASTDKGKAVSVLLTLYRDHYGEIVTLGLGDSENDLPLLAATDHPFVVQQPNGRWHDFDGLPVTRVPLPGPSGWAAAVAPYLSQPPR